MYSAEKPQVWPAVSGCLLVCGSRSFTDYPALCATIDALPTVRAIIHGGANGADQLAARYAAERGLKAVAFLPNWHLHGRAAGPIRNQDMVFTADCAVAFWDGFSAGTLDTLTRLRRAGIPYRIHDTGANPCPAS